MNCQRCDEDGVLHQYAYEATSPHACDTSGYWTPEEAVGELPRPFFISQAVNNVMQV